MTNYNIPDIIRSLSLYILHHHISYDASQNFVHNVSTLSMQANIYIHVCNAHAGDTHYTILMCLSVGEAVRLSVSLH
jgi:hypothetical protein